MRWGGGTNKAPDRAVLHVTPAVTLRGIVNAQRLVRGPSGGPSRARRAGCSEKLTDSMVSCTISCYHA